MGFQLRDAVFGRSLQGLNQQCDINPISCSGPSALRPPVSQTLYSYAMKLPTGSHSYSRQLTTRLRGTIVDLFLPGLRSLKRAICQMLRCKNKNVTYITYLLAIIAVMKPYAANMTFWLQKYFTSTVHIHSTNETHDMLTSWIAARGLEDAARSVLAKVHSKRGYMEDGLKRAERPLKYSAYQEGFYFWYKNSLLFYKSTPEGKGYNKQEEVSVTCLGRSPQILKNLLKECQDEYLSHLEKKTAIYGHSGANWEREKAKDVRPLSTVLLREAEKAPLIEDMSDFLHPDTRKWYSQRSLPYRRGYLFHGPPGTGKSSFSLSVAGELEMDIYVLSIPCMNDLTLKTLFNALPDRCVVLLEDIDAVGSARSRAIAPVGPKELSDEGQGVTLSGLLNVIDGVSAQEGRVLIMTTNHMDHLDDALIRPGRVDKKVEFQLADREVIIKTYRYMFEQTSDTPDGIETAVNNGQSIDNQALEFACKIPEWTFSPAQIISYLLQHRDMPSAALENVEAWIADVRENNDRRSATQPVIAR